MENLLRCCLCQDHFDEDENKWPYLLYCGHTVCSKDLKSLLGSYYNKEGYHQESTPAHPEINCPICQEKIDFKYFENFYPPKNQAILDLLDDYTKETPTGGSSSEHTPTICNNCKATSAVFSCPSCEVELCLECDKLVHSLKVFENHNRQTMLREEPSPTLRDVSDSILLVSHGIPSNGSVQKEEYCPLHPKEMIRCYCLDATCVQSPFLCVICALHSSHRQHNVVPMEEAYSQLKERFILEEALQTTQLMNQLEQFQARLSTTSHYNQLNYHTTLRSIRQDFLLFREILDRFEQKLLHHLEGESSSLEQEIIQIKLWRLQYSQQMMFLSQRIQSLLLSSNSYHFLKDRLKLTERVQSVAKGVTSFLERTIIPTMQSRYDLIDFIPSLEIKQFLPDHEQLNEIFGKEGDDLFVQTPPVEENREEVLSAEVSKEKDSASSVIQSREQKLLIGSLLSRLLTTVEEIDRGLPFHPSLVVREVLQLEAKEIYLFSSVTIQSQGILTVQGWDGVTDSAGVLYLMIQGSLLIEPHGQINLVGKGYRGGAGSLSIEIPADGGEPLDDETRGKGGHGSSFYGSIGGGGGGYMTCGRSARPNTFGGQSYFGGYGGSALTIDSNESIESYMRMGSGGGGAGGGMIAGEGEELQQGGNGGNGGGLLILQATEIRNFGTITVNGENGQDGNCQNTGISGGGGGSGGCIKMVCSSFLNYGSVTAKGGKGGVATFVENSPQNNCSNGGDGGDGLIVLQSVEEFVSSPSSEITPSPYILSLF